MRGLPRCRSRWIVRPDDVGLRMTSEAESTLIVGWKRSSARHRGRVERASLALERLEPRWLLARANVATDALEYFSGVLGRPAAVARTALIDVARPAPNPPVDKKGVSWSVRTPTPESAPTPPYLIVFETPGPHATLATAQELRNVRYFGIVGTLLRERADRPVPDPDRPDDPVAPVHPEVGSAGGGASPAAPTARCPRPLAGRLVAGRRSARSDLEHQRSQPAAGLGALSGDHPGRDERRW